MENMAIMQILFTFFVGAVVGLIVANCFFVLLRFTHRQDIVTKIGKAIEPYIAYIRLGDVSATDIKHSRRA